MTTQPFLKFPSTWKRAALDYFLLSPPTSFISRRQRHQIRTSSLILTDLIRRNLSLITVSLTHITGAASTLGCNLQNNGRVVYAVYVVIAPAYLSHDRLTKPRRLPLLDVRLGRSQD